MSDIEFDTPASRVIKQFSGKDEEQFRIPTNLPDLSFLRALSVQGRLFYQNAIGANDFTMTHNVAVGSTDFIYRIVFSVTGVAQWTFVLNNDGQQRIRITITEPFVLDLLDSLVGDGAKTITIDATENSGTSSGTISLFGWSENTSRIRDVTI